MVKVHISDYGILDRLAPLEIMITCGPFWTRGSGWFRETGP